MKKYVMFAWVMDACGWYMKDTLEKAKETWAFGRSVFEVPKEDVEELFNELGKIKGNDLRLEKMEEKYSLVYQEGEVFEWHLNKI